VIGGDEIVERMWLAPGGHHPVSGGGGHRHPRPSPTTLGRSAYRICSAS